MRTVLRTRLRRSLAPVVLCALGTRAAAQGGAGRAAGSRDVVEGQTTITLPDTVGYSAVERTLIRLERRRSAAIAGHDTMWLATLYAPDFQGVVATGRRVDRAALFGVFARDNPGARFLFDELEARELTPGTATVTGRLRSLAADGSVGSESRYLHVYVRTGRRWQLRVAEGTAVAAPVTPPGT
jgi:hypothetical protein